MAVQEIPTKQEEKGRESYNRRVAQNVVRDHGADENDEGVC